MTLVVAHQYPKSGLHLVADTRISYDTEPAGQAGRSIHQRLDHAVLKLVVSSDRRRVLGFCGPLTDNLQDVLRLAHDPITSDQAVAGAATETARDTAAQFVMARLDPVPSITRIDGSSTSSEPSEWIGSRRAVEAFQAAYGSTRDSPARRMERALTAVLNDGLHDVGGFVVRVSQTAGGGLGYFVLEATDFGDASIRQVGSGGLEVQSRSDGAFVSLGFRAVEEYPAVGWWFPQRETGYVSAPLIDLEPAKLSATSSEEFRSLAAQHAQHQMVQGNVVRIRSEHR